MIVYRIARNIHSDDLSGTGSALYGGRWNPVGTRLLYTSGSISLAYLEYLAHNIHILNTKPVALVKIEIPDDSPTSAVKFNNLPKDWDEKTYTPQSTQKIGHSFLEKGKYHVLKVPSAIVPDEVNYLLDPSHPNHSKVRIIDKIDPFVMDQRFGK